MSNPRSVISVEVGPSLKERLERIADKHETTTAYLARLCIRRQISSLDVELSALTGKSGGKLVRLSGQRR